jgi:polysaccharide pyruvyl transferase WcaK-like protein
MDVEGKWPLSELAPLVRAVDRWRAPMVFVGVGTEPLQFETSREIVASVIAPRVRHWSVRCDRDRARLVEYGVAPDAITVAADLAWLIDAADCEDGRRRLQQIGADLHAPLFAVNLVNENALFDREPRIVGEFAASLDEIAGRTGGQVLFLSNEVREDSGFDKAAAGRVIAQMRRKDRALLMPNAYVSPREMMSIVGCCSLAISMRYHFLMFSALQGVPFLAIERSGKIADFCWDLRWASRVAPSELDKDSIVCAADRLLHNNALTAEWLRQGVETMRERARRNMVALETLTAPGQALQFTQVARRIRNAMLEPRR